MPAGRQEVLSMMHRCTSLQAECMPARERRELL